MRTMVPTAIWSVFFHASRCSALTMLAAVTALLCLGQAAQARMVTVIITGSMYSGTDYSGAFIKPGASLAKDAFNLTYTINDALGAPCGGGNSCIKLNGTSAPITSVVLIINGKPFTFVSNSFSKVQAQTIQRWLAPPPSYLSFQETEEYTGEYRGTSLVNIDYLPVTSAEAQFPCWEYPLDPPILEELNYTNPYNRFYIQVSPVSLQPKYLYYAEGYFIIQTITITSSPPSPPERCFIFNSH